MSLVLSNSPPEVVLLAVNYIIGQGACHGESAIWIGKAGGEAIPLLWRADCWTGVIGGGTPTSTSDADSVTVDAMWAHHKARFVEAEGCMVGGADYVVGGATDKVG